MILRCSCYPLGFPVTHVWRLADSDISAKVRRGRQKMEMETRSKKYNDVAPLHTIMTI